MTNLMAAIVVLVSTNWSSIGTFTDTSGNSFDVQQGRQVTNTVAIIEFERRKHEFTLKFELGPVVGEKKLPAFQYLATNGLWIERFNMTTNIYVPL